MNGLTIAGSNYKNDIEVIRQLIEYSNGVGIFKKLSELDQVRASLASLEGAVIELDLLKQKK